MEPNGDANPFQWKYLIKPDKSATPQLEDLCIGLAKCIVDNEPGLGTELSPQRLAAFYRRVGGNYDTLFLKSGDIGLSFIYRTFGCFHSLQPSQNPFETPAIPCLTPHGFARWQTLQLLLSPEESVVFLQKAVQLYRIPKSGGGFFPSSMPTSCFPSHPDQQMEEWYNNVTGHLNQDNYMRRIKQSPYQSPYPEDRRDGYFQNGSRSSSAEDQARIDAYRRRSSVPDVMSPVAVPVPVDRPSHWDPHGRGPRKARSHSAQRPTQPSRQRSHTASTHDRPARYPPNSSHLHRPTSQQQPPTSHRHRVSDGRSPHSRNNSASDASSENSHIDHPSPRPRKSEREESPKRRRSSLWPPSFFRSHKRRHSSDAGPRKLEAPPAPKPPIPLRPEYYHRKPQPPTQQVPYAAAMPVQHAPSAQRPHSGVRFRSDMFDDPNHSGPDSPNHPPPPGFDPRTNPPPNIRYPDGAGPALSRESSSGSGTDRRHHSDFDRGQRKAGLPIRVATVSGVGGRKYPNTETPNDPYHPSSRARGNGPTPV